MTDLNLYEIITLIDMTNREYFKAKANGRSERANELQIIINKLTAKKYEFVGVE